MIKRYPDRLSSFFIFIGAISQILETASSSNPPIANIALQSSSANKSEGEVNQEIPTLMALVKELKAECGSLNQRLISVENRSINQENEIEILKNNLTSVRKEVLKEHRQQKKMNEEIEIAEPPNTIDTSSMLSRRGRPAQLIPLQLHNGPMKSDSMGDNFGRNLPTSCNDLSRMGHTINGIFLVNKVAEHNTNSNKLKLAAVFCDFQPPLPTASHSIALGKQLGFLNVKSYPSGVYFYVQQSLMPSKYVTVINFNLQLVNLGNAMNMSTGVFTAPVFGIYLFSFSISKYGLSVIDMYVQLRHNSKKIGVSLSNAGLYSGVSSFQSIIALKKGDRVDLYMERGRILDDVSRCNHFSGMLLDEELTYNQL